MTLTNTLLLLPLALPVLHVIAALSAALRTSWRLTVWLSLAGLATAIASAIFAIGYGQGELARALVSPAPASHLIAVLIAFLGLIISSFSRHYLAGEARVARFTATLHLALAAVAIVVLTDQLLVLVAGWIGISLALHELLLFYPERPRAALAAHKKFLFARIAELCLLAAALLLYKQHGTWQVSEILSAYPAELTGREQLAAFLLAVTALIKCAQLPMHGWLIQVVEAPTPVSALLHAGIINLGGYLLILFAPLLASAAPATWLLLVVAGLTTAIASLIMSTRVTIKVKLAWSTTAQMGLMLLQCALGLYDLALLHLLAHACYKAYLFLRAGSVVDSHVERRLVTTANAGRYAWAAAAAAAIGLSVLLAEVFTPGGPLSPWLLLAAMLTVLLAERDSVSSGSLPSTVVALGGVLVIAFVAQKLAIAGVVAGGLLLSTSWVADAWVASLVLVVFAVWSLLKHAPALPLSRTLSTWLYAGLYLDEWATRTTLALWPIRLPIRANDKRLGALGKEVD